MLSAVVTALLLQGAPAAEVGLKPVWTDRPTAQQGSRVYPEAAMKAGQGGRASIRCTVTSDGRLDACVVVSETPTGLGFGEAALALAANWRMKPRDEDGVAVAGKLVRLSVGFKPPLIYIEAHDGWEVLQQPYDWDPKYPEAALAAGISGRVVVECKGGKRARKVTCTAVEETPAGHEFGAVAIALRSTLLMKPPPEGAAATGYGMRMTVHFRAPAKQP